LQNNAQAQLNLGMMYGLGQGVEQSDENAVKWYLKAAESGNETAMTNVAYMYLRGQGVTASMKESLKWLYIPAKNGNERALAAYRYICKNEPALCEN